MPGRASVTRHRHRRINHRGHRGSTEEEESDEQKVGRARGVGDRVVCRRMVTFLPDMPSNIEIKARAENFERKRELAERLADGPPQVIRQQDTFLPVCELEG